MALTDPPQVENRGIPLDVVRHVLWFFGDAIYGIEPGMFRQRLMLAVSGADQENREQLRKAFPELVGAMNLAQHQSEGIDQLRAIAKAADL